MPRGEDAWREGRIAPRRILIADHDARVRRGLRALIEAQPGWTVVGEAATTLEVLQLDTALYPDVIVLDLGLPDVRDGLALTRTLAGERHRPVLAISVRGGLRAAALAAGAQVFVEAGVDTDTLVLALHRVIALRAESDTR
jgi:DNA-binding NarL/FixJ family response regulator